MSIDLLLQSLCLWNCTIDSLTRLNFPSCKIVQDNNLFDMLTLKQALPNDPQSLPDPIPQITILP